VLLDSELKAAAAPSPKPKPNNPSIPEDQEPLIPDVELDDAAIHFRCGDVMMGGAKWNDFGMIKFSEYKKWISPDARSHNWYLDSTLLEEIE
jgi:hypothetical protein